MEDTRQLLLNVRTLPSPGETEGNERTPLDELEVRAHSALHVRYVLMNTLIRLM